MSDVPRVLNPEAIGDPDQTPIVQLPPAMAAHFERTRCAECGRINHCHTDDCPLAEPESHAPCCAACGGRGGTESGPCWDCRGTGHPHALPPIGDPR